MSFQTLLLISEAGQPVTRRANFPFARAAFTPAFRKKAQMLAQAFRYRGRRKAAALIAGRLNDILQGRQDSALRQRILVAFVQQIS